MAENGEMDSFILKHWALAHENDVEMPVMRFSVVQGHMDALTRILQEAVLIEEEGNMNWKGEWRTNIRRKLVLETYDWEDKKASDEEVKKKWALQQKISELLEKP